MSENISLYFHELSRQADGFYSTWEGVESMIMQSLKFGMSYIPEQVLPIRFSNSGQIDAQIRNIQGYSQVLHPGNESGMSFSFLPGAENLVPTMISVGNSSQVNIDINNTIRRANGQIDGIVGIHFHPEDGLVNQFSGVDIKSFLFDSAGGVSNEIISTVTTFDHKAFLAVKTDRTNELIQSGQVSLSNIEQVVRDFNGLPAIISDKLLYDRLGIAMYRNEDIYDSNKQFERTAGKYHRYQNLLTAAGNALIAGDRLFGNIGL